VNERKKEVGETVRRCREAKGLTQAQLAERLGYNKKRQDVIAAIEAGRRLPPAGKLRKLVEVCDCKLEDIIE
jgi:transcriptional regulator with XRE-family HTH domain